MDIVVVEDETIAARRLIRMINEVQPKGVTSIVHCATLAEACSLVQSGKHIDVVFLDLNLHGDDGFDLVRNATAQSFQTIVVSANTEKALEAFEYGVLDFVPKPFDKERLSRAFARLNQTPVMPEETCKFLSIKNMGKVDVVQLDEVLYFKGADDYVEVHRKQGDMLLHTKTLEGLEMILPAEYLRIHKSYLVKTDDIARILVHGGGKYEAELTSGHRLPVARARYKDLQERML